LLLRNWQEGKHEIDAIYRDGECLVFVEVRARASDAKVSGYHSLGKSKRQAMRRAAYAYMRTLPKRPLTFRYDSVELGMQGENAAFIRHHRNIRVF
jgi:putative endonuclease